MSAHNAESVVAAWRAGQHEQAWGEPAREMSPSALNFHIVEAHVRCAQVADGEADRLVALGFSSGHSTIRELRGRASTSAQQAQRAQAWAAELMTAEQAL